MVSVKYAGGDNWPASGQQSVGYAFTEDAPAEIDVKYHAGSSEYVATYVTADREIGTLTSTDGVRFTVADPAAGRFVLPVGRRFWRALCRRCGYRYGEGEILHLL